MRFLSFVLLCVVASLMGVCGLSVAAPSISDTFQSGVTFEQVRWGINNEVNQMAGGFFQSIEYHSSLYVVNQSSVDVLLLKRFDIGMEYDFAPATKYCTSKKITDKIGLFSWLQYSLYQGPRVLNAAPVDLWALNVTDPTGLGSLGAYVSNNVPQRLVVEQANEKATTIINFYQFKPIATPINYFNVPDYCTTNKQQVVDHQAKQRIEAVHQALKAIGRHH